MTSEALKSRTRDSLASMARRRGISRWHSMTKDELVRALRRVAQAKRPASSNGSRSHSRNGSHRRASGNGKSHTTNGKAHSLNGKAKKNGKHSNGHVVPVLSRRDLCTTEVSDKSNLRKNYLDATVCDSHWIRADWDLTRDSIRRAETKLGTLWHRALPVLRVVEVANDDVNSVSEARVRDVPIEAGISTWYVHVPGEAKAYRLQIGYRTENGGFYSLAKSNTCTMPILNANLATDKNGKAVEDDVERRDHSVAAPKLGGRLGRPLGFSSLTHFGPAASEERERGTFTFKLDSELIIHGTTQPGSTLTVEGEKVDLREDGSFTIRLNQPEGRQVITFTAMSPRGGERRMVVLGVERNTKELERQYFDGGHPEGHGD